MPKHLPHQCLGDTRGGQEGSRGMEGGTPQIDATTAAGE